MNRLPSLQETLAQFDAAWRSAKALHFGLLLFAGLLYFLYTDREIPSLWLNSSLVLLFYLGLYFGHFQFCLRPFAGSFQGCKRCKWRKWLWAALLAASSAGLLLLAIWSYSSAQAPNLQEALNIRKKILFLCPLVLLLEVAALFVTLRPQGRKAARPQGRKAARPQGRKAARPQNLWP